MRVLPRFSVSSLSSLLLLDLLEALEAVVLLLLRVLLPLLLLTAALLLRAVGRVDGVGRALALLAEAVEVDARPLPLTSLTEVASFLVFLPFFTIVMAVVGRSADRLGLWIVGCDGRTILKSDWTTRRVLITAAQDHDADDLMRAIALRGGGGLQGRAVPPVWQERGRK